MKGILLKVWKVLRLPTNLQLFLMRQVNDQFLVGVTGIFLTENNETLLVKHTYRDKDNWSLPGGYAKGREHPKEALEREIKEESGFVVSVDKRIKIRTDRETARLDIVYAGKFIGGEFTPSKEVKEAGLFAFDDLPEIPQDQLFFIARTLGKI
jgi:ADP-ribose pyrophosphatase YjhB (NUDIX family)